MSNPKPIPTYNQYKIRAASANHIGKVYELTIPREIAEQYMGIKFTIETCGDNILLKSGLDLKQLNKKVTIGNI